MSSCHAAGGISHGSVIEFCLKLRVLWGLTPYLLQSYFCGVPIGVEKVSFDCAE